MLEMHKRYICENCGEPVERDLPELNCPMMMWNYAEIAVIPKIYLRREKFPG
jgi:hypothetical protein